MRINNSKLKWILAATIFLAILFVWQGIKVDKNQLTENKVIVEKPVIRESITFILGEDREADNPFYQEAMKYFQHHPADRTEIVINSCRSMEAARAFLLNNQPGNGLPWGKINLVSHGNQWIGLSVPVSEEIKRTTVSGLEIFLTNEKFRPLPQTVIDAASEIDIYGCGIGNNTALLKTLGKFFSGEAGQPQIHASLNFETFTSRINHHQKLVCNRMATKPYFAFYQRGYRPGDIRLARQLSQNYPQATLNWRKAISREQPGMENELYHYTFDIPVKWFVLYPHVDSLPALLNESDEQNWLREQHELVDMIEKTKIPLSKFNWNLKKIKYPLEDGSLVPAIRIRGYCTVLCVLQPITKNL